MPKFTRVKTQDFMSQELFDALQYAESLEAAGFDTKQARAIARGARDAHNFDALATKSDLREVERALKSDIREVEQTLRSEIRDVEGKLRELELRMVIKLGSLMLLAVGAVAALVKLL